MCLINGIDNSLFEEQAQSNEQLLSFHELLKNALFLNKVQAAYNKAQLEKFLVPIDIDLALHKHFIKFGTRKATRFIIIDIDHCKMNITNFAKKVDYILDGYKPNWITKTKRGFHIGFILKLPVYFNNSIDTDILNETKKLLSLMFNADIFATLRKTGFYRNPLTHESILNTNTHTLESLHKYVNLIFQNSFSLFDTPSKAITKIRNQQKTIEEIKKENIKEKNEQLEIEGFKPGNRNNYLFKMGVKLLYEGKIKNDFNEIYNYFASINNDSKNPLSSQEIERIAKSLYRYDIKVKTTKKLNTNEYKKGIYWEDMNYHGIHNYKNKNKSIDNSRQKFGQIIRTIKVTNKTIENLVSAYKKIYVDKLKFTNKQIEENSNLSIRTIQRYRNNRKIEQDIKSTAFKLYIFSIGKIKSVMAKVTPLIFLKNLLIKTIEFHYKKDGKIFYFELSKEERLIFYSNKENVVA